MVPTLNDRPAVACKFITLKREEDKKRGDAKQRVLTFRVCRVENDRHRRDRGGKKAISRVDLVAYLHNCHERIIRRLTSSLLFRSFFNVELTYGK